MKLSKIKNLMLTSMGPFLRRTRRCFANSECLFANCNDHIISVASVTTVLPSNQIDRNCDVLPIVEYSIETDDGQTLN